MELEAAAGGVARVGEEVIAGLGSGFVQAVETLERHHNLATHFEELGIVAMQFERHGMNGLHVGGDVVALSAVATSHGADECAVFILQADGKTVKFQLTAKLHFILNGFLNAVDKLRNLLTAV